MSCSASRRSRRIASGTAQAPFASSRSRGRTERRPHRGDHGEVGRLLEPDLEVERVEAAREAVRALRREVVGVAAGEVVEVRHLAPHETAEQPVERDAGAARAEVPQRHVDAGPGEVARADPELPEAVAEEVRAHGLAVPGIAADDERPHRVDRGLHRGDVGAAARLAVADEAVVGLDAHDDVGHAVARDLARDLAMEVGHGHDRRLQARDPHSSPPEAAARAPASGRATVWPPSTTNVWPVTWRRSISAR